MELISREEAIKTARTMIGLTADERENEIRAIPTVEERKEGKWIDAKWDGEKCSLCGWSIDDTYYAKQFNYCPNCGARMYEDDKDIYVPNKGE